VPRKRVAVVPISHAPRSDPRVAIEIPPRVKKHLGLDGKRSASEYIAGVYPLLPDETCRFLAIDFDAATVHCAVDAEHLIERTLCCISSHGAHIR
jgi:hypothetical protein